MRADVQPAVFVSTPDLRPSVRGILRALEEAGLLAGVATTLAFGQAQWQRRMAIAAGIDRRLGNRLVPEELLGKVAAIWRREVVRVAVSRLAGPMWAHRIWRWAELGFDRNVAARFAGRFRCLYGMEHSSLATFEAQRAAGGFCVLRQVTVHGRLSARTWRRMAERHPTQVGPYQAAVLREMDETIERKEAEVALADLIVGNSQYVCQSFIDEGIDPARVACVPTGCPALSEIPGRSGRGRDRLRFLFVGVLSIRKGILELLQAWRDSGVGGRAELLIAGPLELEPDDLLRDAQNVRYLGNLPRSRLDEVWRLADVFVLPTPIEGLSHAVLEALSSGLPVITTRASGCGSLVEDTVNGFQLPDEEPARIAEALSWCLENRRLLPDMGRRSREKAARWTVADSNRAHLELIQGFLDRGSQRLSLGA